MIAERHFCPILLTTGIQLCKHMRERKSEEEETVNRDGIGSEKVSG